MPHLPGEENAESNITEKVMKSGDNTESRGDSDQNPSIKAKASDFTSKGPQISDKMPEPASKDELKARAAELNK